MRRISHNFSDRGISHTVRRSGTVNLRVAGLLGGIWIVLVAIVFVCARAGPGWLERLAQQDPRPGRRAARERMESVRVLLSPDQPDTPRPSGPQSDAAVVDFARAVRAERSGDGRGAEQWLRRWRGSPGENGGEPPPGADEKQVAPVDREPQ